ncbi:KAP family NTPase [Aliirhizobium terrae]|uniref:KAP family P-loop NTPase fold protein n=1 Tax=Terrirhizobium terrae TaxID=2926709 RepID=UPI0025782889|nr:P-loop NTPase fold protein [Rhizobium sp. CC-CFT758]WJH40701.1 KAP family NTPase [Rhizobium sp. CC-CFT758]
MGRGKSFFLDGLAQDLDAKGHIVARVNAWRDDHAQDPYVAIMAAIDQVFAPYVKKQGEIAKAWSAAKSSGGAIALKVTGAVFKGLVRKHAGVSLDEIGEIINETGFSSETLEDVADDGIKAAGKQLEKLFDASLEAMIDGFNRTDAAMADFRDKLERAIHAIGKSKSAPLFILVDELDRCRPTYAVQLLERVKHLFDVPGVVFVFGTNADQLQHSIAGSYGANFDGFRYLKRFFDRTYVFEEPLTENLVKDLCAMLPAEKLSAPENDVAQAVGAGCKAYGLDLRAIRQVLEMVDAAASAWPHQIPADVVLLFPLCANFYKTGKAEWPSFQEQEIVKWTLPRTRVDRFERIETDFTINYGEAYRYSVGSFRTMEGIRAMSSRSDRGIAFDYARRVFEPEWSGMRVSERQPSIQTELLGIVANAGRMVNASVIEKERV